MGLLDLAGEYLKPSKLLGPIAPSVLDYYYDGNLKAKEDQATKANLNLLRDDGYRSFADMTIRDPQKVNAIVEGTPDIAKFIPPKTGTPPTNPEGQNAEMIARGALGNLPHLKADKPAFAPDYSVSTIGSRPDLSNTDFVREYLQKQLERQQNPNTTGANTQFDQQYMDLIEKGAGYLDPYRKAGEQGLTDLVGGLKGGEFDVGKFDYTGQQPESFQYSGQQPDRFSYGESPVDRSIESYMKDDSSLAWQQEQMEKMLERRAAAKGGFGGGGIEREMLRETAGLLSQDYGNRFNRASQERMADVASERDRYGRDLTGYGLDVAREQQGYGRDFDRYGLDVAREQQGYGRQAGEYANEAQRLDQNFNRLSGLAGVGQQASTATGGMYSGLGSQLMGQQFQQSMHDQQLAEQRRIAKAQEEASMWGGLGSLLGAGAGFALGGPAGMAIGSQAGGYLGGQV